MYNIRILIVSNSGLLRTLKNSDTYKVLRTRPGNNNSTLMLNTRIIILISQLSVQIH